jgi:hypothetical protein
LEQLTTKKKKLEYTKIIDILTKRSGFMKKYFSILLLAAASCAYGMDGGQTPSGTPSPDAAGASPSLSTSAALSTLIRPSQGLEQLVQAKTANRLSSQKFTNDSTENNRLIAAMESTCQTVKTEEDGTTSFDRTPMDTWARSTQGTSRRHAIATHAGAAAVGGILVYWWVKKSQS